MAVAHLILKLLPNAATLLLIIPFFLVVHVLWNRYGHGLNGVPGPFLASMTDFWRMNVVWHGNAHVVQRQLHDKYGDVVRLGPKTLSFANPEAVNDIYSGKRAWKKSEFYPVQQVIRAGKTFPTIFSTTDDEYHKRLRRGASNAYALSTLLQFEPFVDSTTKVFVEQIEQRWANQSGAQGICDFATWLQYYAFDVICELTYSNRMGFLEQGTDVNGLIESIDTGLVYAGPIGQYPFWDNFFRKNPVKLLLGRLGVLQTTLTHVAFGLRQLGIRKDKLGDAINKPYVPDGKPRDFLARFMEAHYSTGSITEFQMISLAQANINAGSDTTAISLRAVFYLLLKKPQVLKKLMAAIEDAERTNLFKDHDIGLVSWSEANQIPYLDAVIKESLRCFPAVGLCLERIVPPEGGQIAGMKVPPGTVVGCNAWTIHSRKEVYGEDADDFRPERWLEADEEQLAAMKKYFFTFGMGSHTCIGKNISYLEMYKVVGTLLRRFKIELANPNQEWHLHNSWFVKQSQMDVKFTRRTMVKPDSGD